MKKLYKPTLSLAFLMIFCLANFAQTNTSTKNWGEQGITLKSTNKDGLSINYSITGYSFEDLDIEGEQMKSIKLPDVFLPNNEGFPDLPGTGRYIAIPQGANVTVKIISSRTETLKNQMIAPAPRIPLDTEDGPLHYEKDSRIYSTNAFYPKEPVIISEKTEIRGLDVVMLGITPFQYNPVTKELIVYRDIEIELAFEGGNGIVGDERLRSRWWDPILDGAVLNSDIIPEINYSQQKLSPKDSPDYEYLIITIDDADFLAWADSIKQFRTLQGIRTGIVTTSDIGGNTVSAIETYVDDAYNSWATPPSAVLLLGDYSTGANGITSQIYVHPASYPDFVSDNRFADVTGNDLPDIVFARITANNASQLEVMITKFLDYERNPPTNPDFYDHPITALGWQTERWFQICSEAVGGYLKNELGKSPVRINAVYSGNPSSDPWSTATNTSTVINYFGPNGLGYIPATPQGLGGFSGGSGSQVINAINDGSYMLQHRDHGGYTGWGEPSFNTSSINSLHNVNNELPFIFSINCQTGAFHRTNECFAEKFHRHTYNGQNSGALGIIAATEVSYSFVNDTYVWGVFDNLHPGFLPDYSTEFPVSYVMPAFANASGKHFLYQSSWPYNTSSKQITYRLFHHHGGAFLTLYTEVPQNLTVAHNNVLPAGLTSFNVLANPGSFIALTVNGEIIGTADGTGASVSITIPPQNPGDVMIVTITKQNYYRYSSNVEVVSDGLFAQFSADNTTPCLGGSVNFTDQSYGSPTSWDWSFPGGSPNSYSGQNPPAIQYNTAGSYDVTLTISDGAGNDTETKSGFINVSDITADFTGNPTTLVINSSVTFIDNTSCSPTSWDWSFPGGTPSSSTDQNPVITYNTPGTYSVTLVAANGIGNDTETKTNYITVNEVPLNYCTSKGNSSYYEWISEVELNDFSNPSGAAGYTDFTNLTIGLTPGEEVNITLTPDFSSTVYTEYWRVWIDYNRDGDFEDNGEEVFAPPSSSSSVNGSFIVAANAIGSTRMRITMKWNGVPTPCETFSYGEVEDYTVSFSSPAVEANFTADPTSICEDGQVQFTDGSTGEIVSWQWEFEGGTPTTSSSQNPLVTYSNVGDYDVTLTVFGADSDDELTKTNYITVNSVPAQADVPSGLTSICQGAGQGTYTTAYVPGATSSQWLISPQYAGTIAGNGTSAVVSWDAQFNGQAEISVIAVNACGNGEESDPLIVTVNPLPQVTCPADFAVCIDDPGFTVTGATPEGGVYTGPGMVSDKFFPDMAGVGSHEVTYTYINGNNCVSQCTFNIVVNPLPTLICPNDFSVCIDNGPIDLSQIAVPSGGNFEGAGVVNNVFGPEVAGAGNHEITYTFIETNGCSSTCTFNITVIPLPVLVCPADFEICYNDAPVDLSGATPDGGTYSGTGVTNNTFDPAISGIGTFEVIYTYADENGCQNQCAFNITVNPLPGTAGPITGNDDVCQGIEYNYSTPEILYAESYEWQLDPAGSGSLSQNGLSCAVLWEEGYVGTATLSVRGANLCGNGEWSTGYPILISDCPSGFPPGWDFTPNPSQHTILIPLDANPNIFGESLASGDFVGVFFLDEGVEKCAGAIVWDAQQNNTIMAFGNDVSTPEKDGFNTDEAILWKVYDSGEAAGHMAIAAYDNTFPDHEGTYLPYGLSKLVSLDAFTQQVVFIPEGWSGFSLAMEPLDPDMYEVFSDIINELIILQNNDYVFWPFQGLNTFPGWSETFGAQIKMSEDAILTVSGIPEENDLVLPEGWSFLPISSQCNIDAEDLFIPITDKLEVVKSVASYEVYWPDMSIYTLDVLKPGFSYLIKLSETATLVFPECTDKLAPVSKPSVPDAWQLVKPTPATHMVMIDAREIPNLRIGDFVGSFNENGDCTGSVKLEGSPVALTIFGDDHLTPSTDGMAEGEPINFKVLKPETDEETDITVVFDEKLPDYSGNFKTNGISAFKDSYNGASSIYEGVARLTVYPNPTTGKFMISGLTGFESLIITNMHGQEILNMQMTDNQSVEIDLSNSQNGVYFLTATGQAGKVVRKIVVR